MVLMYLLSVAVFFVAATQAQNSTLTVDLGESFPIQSQSRLCDEKTSPILPQGMPRTNRTFHLQQA